MDCRVPAEEASQRRIDGMLSLWQAKVLPRILLLVDFESQQQQERYYLWWMAADRDWWYCFVGAEAVVPMVDGVGSLWVGLSTVVVVVVP